MDTSKANILIVDDTPENIDVMLGILKQDYNCRVARDGEMALKICAKVNNLDLILLDIMMPGLDGYQVCERLKSDPMTKHIPVIFVTAKISPEDEIRGFELGAVDYIAKPVSPPIVKARVKTHVALFDQKRELSRLVDEQTQTIEETRMKIIQRLGRAAEYKDDDTGMHVVRMAHYSYILAKAAGMPEEQARTLRDAAPMHDIGKIGIPDAILQKPGKLDGDEWGTMQLHVEIGGEILGDDPSDLLHMARVVALTHHEKWNGKGYPKGLAGEDIPLVGRIVAIADVFDALTSPRPYKQAWTVERTIEMFKEEAGGHFDPELIKLFLERLPEVLEVKERFADEAKHD